MNRFKGVFLVMVAICLHSLVVVRISDMTSVVTIEEQKYKSIYLARTISSLVFANKSTTSARGLTTDVNEPTDIVSTSHLLADTRSTTPNTMRTLSRNTRKYFHSNVSTFISDQNYDVLDLLALPNHTISQSSLYNVPKINKMFTVLAWTSYWDVSWFGRDDAHQFDKCVFNNCRLTNSREKLRQADAVMVHTPSIWPSFTFPRRPTKQFWIAVTRESPYTSGGADFRRFNGAFNATATYLTTSEIFFTYGYYVKRTSPLTTNVWTISVDRPKMAAWFVSHCRAQSQRDQFAKKLQQYLQVDIYGKCGPLKCSKKGGNCYSMLERDYKFYLSFENAICTDYVTEKVWNILTLNIIPVVLGGADYKKLLPPKSYIDIKDFSSVKALADYLLMLSKNDVMYREYFAWKANYEVKILSRLDVLCQVCSFLNRFGNTTNVVPRLDQVFGKQENCVKPKDYFPETVASDFFISFNIFQDFITKFWFFVWQ